MRDVTRDRRMAMDDLKYTIIVKPEANTIGVRASVVYIKRRKCSSKVFVDRNRVRLSLQDWSFLFFYQIVESR